MHISRIEIQVIPHNEQRYDTAGDWTIERVTGESGLLRIYVSHLPENQCEWLVAVHELVEALLCHNNNISQERVDAFDMGPGKGLEDPGDSVMAPYHTEHKRAESIEALFSDYLEVSWGDYLDQVKELEYTPKEEKNARISG